MKKEKIRSVFIEARYWHDKTGGSSYFSAQVWINGKWLFTEPFQYGYGRMHEQVAAETLTRLGVFKNDRHGLFSMCQEVNADFYSAFQYTTKRELATEAMCNTEFLAQLTGKTY